MTVSRVALLFATAAFAFPIMAHAEQVTTWNLTVPGSAKQWMTPGLQLSDSTEGLRIVAPSEAPMAREILFTQRIEAMRIVFSRSQRIPFLLLWHVRGTPPSELVQLPADLQGTSPETLDIDFSRFPQWDEKTDLVGFAFSAGTDVTVREISFHHWNAFEKIIEAFKGFWVPDRMESYSINFLWGPLLIFNSFARAELYTTLPPAGWSVNRLFYAVIFLAGLVFATWAWHRPYARRQALMGMLWFCAGVWIFYDLRMGGEIIHYAVTDLKNYVAKPVEQRTLRSLVNFHGVLEMSMPFLTERDRYGLIVPQGTPLPGHALYATYPASIPLQQGESPAGKTRTWLVFYRPDIRMNEKRELTNGSEVLAPPGNIVRQFDAQSFIFQSDQ